MTAFVVPPSQVSLTDLPPAIRTSEPGSFARYTLTDRVPGILRETAALNDFPDEIQRGLEDLHAELTGDGVREVREEAPDRGFWNAVSAPHLGRSWLDVPWYWGEAYFYRRLLEATGYFRPGPWRSVDPFGPKKATELAPDAAPACGTRVAICVANCVAWVADRLGFSFWSAVAIAFTRSSWLMPLLLARSVRLCPLSSAERMSDGCMSSSCAAAAMAACAWWRGDCVC